MVVAHFLRVTRRMLHTAAHEGADAAVFNAGRGHGRGLESSARTRLAGAIVENAAAGQSACPTLGLTVDNAP